MNMLDNNEKTRPSKLSSRADEPIAIVGMAGRFPGAPDVETFWRKIKAGEDLVTRFRPEEIEDGFPPETRASPDYVPARPILDDVDLFDAHVFGMYPREAALTDPQARIFLEICWEALEDAGCDPSRYPGAIGVWAGCSMSTYFLHHVMQDRAAIEEFTSNYQVGCYPQLLCALTDTFATRVAYKLDLRGPAVTLHTACSTSLTAVAQACQSLALGHADMALAGGVSITFPQRRGYLYQDGGMASRDGRCRPFDADADGTVFGSGAGVVVLKRLADALADRDQVYAVIRGCGINNDGSDKIAFTAPSIAGQAEAIALAHAMADVDPADVGYVECHGTATPLGDPIEFQGLTEAFGPRLQAESCALGSAKANIGHLDAAAGITGLIKTALVLRDGVIPPMTHYRTPNPRIDIENSRFYVPTELKAWPSDGRPRLAGVSSFGVGGTNVHIVMQEPPAEVDRDTINDETAHILPLSAETPEQVATLATSLASRLTADENLSVRDVALTLQRGRRVFRNRLAIVCRDRRTAIDGLRERSNKARQAAEAAPSLIFLFPGQGAQYPGMGSGLYRSEPAFAEWIDRGAEILRPLIDCDISQLLCYGEPTDAEAARALSETRLTQPALFLTEFALAKLWMSWGLMPDAMVGHSVGEFTAAALSGVIGFDDAIRLIAARGRLMQAEPAGAMLSVRASVETLRDLLVDGIDIAARNAPQLSVLAGPFEAVQRMEEVLAGADIAAKRLHTSHAFHSAMMDPVVEAMRHQAGDITYRSPSIPFVSTATGQWVSPERPWSSDYVAHHCRATVVFQQALETACEGRTPALLEVGPGRTLLAFSGQTLGRDRQAVLVQSLPDHDRALDDETSVATAFGDLWCAGANVDFARLSDRGGRTVSLPTYPFQRKRHWIDPPRYATADAPLASAPADQPAITPDAAPSSQVTETTMTISIAPVAADNTELLKARLLEILADLSGDSFEAKHADCSFLELGFDSLFLGQFAQRIERDFKVAITFRQLLADIPSVRDLADHLKSRMPVEVAAPVAPMATNTAAPMAPEPPRSPAPNLLPTPTISVAAAAGRGSTDAETLMQAQVRAMQTLFTQQLQALGALASSPNVETATQSMPQVASAAAAAPSAQPAAPAPQAIAPTVEEPAEDANPRFALARIKSRIATERTPAQDSFIADLTARTCARNAKSKAYTATHRPALADPRAAAGFRAEWKEMAFPLVSGRSKGSRIWDIDGNEYIDLVNGYGQTAFGHAPDFVLEALSEQMAAGFAIGPQADLAGEVAELLAEMTGHQRITFCNTGSEAVMAAMRVARAVTGRERVVVFANDYHGQFDEVLVKGRAKGGAPAALPIAPGIPRASVGNMVVLPYGDPASLDWIRAQANDLAAVIIEPVQSRHPELRPLEFVRELRQVTQNAGIALVFDEVVTGFRVHPAGMQGLWGIKGDLATYGKVVGGGMPIGILAGRARFMDALDGGQWSYGDASVPEVAPTFFAGTFVRHPLVLAATRAVLRHLKDQGAALLERTAQRTGALVSEINGDLSARGVPVRAETFSSWFMVNFGAHDPLGSLVYPALRLSGIHIQEGYPCFLTTAHSEADFEQIAKAFRDAIDSVQAVGILAAAPVKSEAVQTPANGPEPDQAAPTEAPLTEPQTEIWLASQLGDEASCAFNESVSVHLEGRLDIAALEDALAELVRRHDALRARFSPSGDRFTVVAPFRLEPERIDLTSESDPDAALAIILHDDADTAFDLVAGPPVRALLVKMASDRFVLVLTAHHIICDGWSINALLKELSVLYSARLTGTTPDLPPVRGFAHYALDQAAARDTHGKEEAYWLAEFATIPEQPELPQDRPRPTMRTFGGATATGFVDADLRRALKAAGAKQGATLFTTLFSSLQVLIGRLSGASDIVLAVPTAGQILVDDPVLVGHCVNFLPIRSPFDASETMAEHLKKTQRRILRAFDHQDFTYGTLVRKLDLPRGVDRPPLTSIQFNLERVAPGAVLQNLKTTVVPNPKARANFDAFFNVVESEDGLRIDVDFNTEIFERETIERWLSHWRTLLAAIATDAEQRICDLPLLSAAELEHLINGVNATKADYDRSARVHDLIAAQAAHAPDVTAFVHQDRTMTYRELMERSDRLAAHLSRRLPPRPGRVAVAVERSPDMVVALLGILKSGRAYVPLDPRHPHLRLSAVLQQATPDALICHDEAIAALGRDRGAEIIRIDKPLIDDNGEGEGLLVPVEAEDPAYVIFTSGSTGTPKGVEIPHRAVVNFLASMAERPGLTADDTVLAVTTVSFDIAVLELLLPLTVGAKVVIADHDEVLDGFKLVERIAAGGITLMQATPTLWSMLLEAGLEPDPSLLLLAGGESLPLDLAHRLAPIGRELWNMYGPTETTIWSSVAEIREPIDRITIGRPIDNTELHLLDENGNVAPIGVVGELWIGGDGLAIGYHGQPGLTAAAFQMRSLAGRPPRRLYRTGDVGRRLADGTIQLFGRRDGQVKLRGFRIELGDVEAAIRTANDVLAAAADVRANPNGDRQLIGYFVTLPGAEPSASTLAAHVAAQVPNYMVPSVWMKLDRLPLTGNGKLDRKALPSPAEASSAGNLADRVVTPPADELEQTLVEIWSDVLGITPIGTTDNLFALGADSLNIFRIAARMIDRNLGLEARHLMQHPTIAELAAFARAAGPASQRVGIPSLKAFRHGARRNETVDA